MGERLEDLMKSVLEDIKNQEYKQAYLFFGEEGYLKKQYRNKLLQAWNPDGDTMNESRFEGKEIDVKEVISLGETMPFFSDRRIILLENTGFFKNQCPELAEYLNNLPDYLYLLFVEDEVDKRSKMFKSVKQIGRMSLEVIDTFCCGICDIYEKKNANGRYLIDGLHPNAAGAKKIGVFNASAVIASYR